MARGPESITFILSLLVFSTLRRSLHNTVFVVLLNLSVVYKEIKNGKMSVALWVNVKHFGWN